MRRIRSVDWATLVLCLAALAGAVSIALAWRGAVASSFAPIQVPWFVSGALAGVALIGAAIGFLGIHSERRSQAAEQQLLDILIEDIDGLGTGLRRGRR